MLLSSPLSAQLGSDAEVIDDSPTTKKKISLATSSMIGIVFHQPFISGNRPKQTPGLFGIDYTFSPEKSLWAISVFGQITANATSDRDTIDVNVMQVGIQGRYFLDGEPTGIYAFGDLALGQYSWVAVESPISSSTVNTLTLSPSIGLGYLLRLVDPKTRGGYSRNHLFLNAQLGIGYLAVISGGESPGGAAFLDQVAVGPSASPIPAFFRITAGYAF